MKNKMKKLLSLGMAATLVFSLTACAGGNSEEKDDSKKEGKTTIKWYMAGSGPQADVETVQNAVNDYLAEKYDMNIDLQLIMTDYGNYPQKMQMIISSGEEYDICWTSDWNNNYYDNVNKNAFLELDDLLEKEGAELKKSMDDSVWDATRVKGNIYGVPAQQIFPKQNYVVILKDYVDKYKLDTSSVHELADLEDFFLQVKKDNPDMYPFAASSNGLTGKLYLSIGFEPIAGNKVPGVLKLDGTDYKIVNQYSDLSELTDFYEMMYRWQEEGLVRQDAATVSDNAVPDMKAGKHISCVNATYKPGVEATEKANFGGKDVVIIPISEGYTATSSMTSSLNAISRTSKNPEMAMKLLNLVNTDATLYNLLCFGVEDVHYTLDDQGKVVTDDSKGYNPNVDWMFGNQFNGLLREGQNDDDWEKTKEMNDAAVQSRILGFAFDSTSVTNEMAAVNSVVDQYALSLETGAVDPKTTMPEFIKKLEAAGSDTIVKEMQKQLDAWVAENK